MSRYTNTRISLAVAAFLSLILLQVAVAKGPKIKRDRDIVLIVQDCKLKLKQTATGFEFGGLDFTKGPVTKVGSVKLDPKLLQAMNAQAQVLDQFQFTSCQQLNTIPLTDPKRTAFVALNGLSLYQLSQLAFLAQMYSDNAENLKEALLKWIVSSSELAQQVWAKQFLAAEAGTEEKRASVAQSLEFALTGLRVSPDSPEFSKLLSDPLRAALP